MTDRPQDGDDEWITSMRADEGISEQSSDEEQDAPSSTMKQPVDNAELPKPTLDIGAVDEGDVKFVDNPFSKAARAAQVRKQSASATVASAPKARAALIASQPSPPVIEQTNGSASILEPRDAGESSCSLQAIPIKGVEQTHEATTVPSTSSPAREPVSSIGALEDTPSAPPDWLQSRLRALTRAASDAHGQDDQTSPAVAGEQREERPQVTDGDMARGVHATSDTQQGLVPAWVRVERTGPLAGRLAFEAVSPEMLASMKATPSPRQPSPVKTSMRDAQRRQFDTSSCSFDSSLLSRFEYKGGRDGADQDDSGDKQSRWASSSSTMVASSSPRPAPTSSKLKRSPPPVMSDHGSIWPGLAAKHDRGANVAANSPRRTRRGDSPTRPREGEDDEDDDGTASWSTLWAGSGNRMPRLRLPMEARAHKMPRTNDAPQGVPRRVLAQLNGDRGQATRAMPNPGQRNGASASGATIRLSSAFRVPGLRLGVTAPAQGGDHLSDPTPDERPSRRLSFAPTPLEVWKSACERGARGPSP